MCRGRKLQGTQRYASHRISTRPLHPHSCKRPPDIRKDFDAGKSWKSSAWSISRGPAGEEPPPNRSVLLNYSRALDSGKGGQVCGGEPAGTCQEAGGKAEQEGRRLTGPLPPESVGILPQNRQLRSNRRVHVHQRHIPATLYRTITANHLTLSSGCGRAHVRMGGA